MYFYVARAPLSVFVSSLTQQHKQPQTTEDAVKQDINVFHYHLVMIPSDDERQPAQGLYLKQKINYDLLCVKRNKSQNLLPLWFS